MVHEIFIVEDQKKLINDLTPEFKNNNDIILKHMPSRKFKHSSS